MEKAMSEADAVNTVAFPTLSAADLAAPTARQ
jgi:hypothetical protein